MSVTDYPSAKPCSFKQACLLSYHLDISQPINFHHRRRLYLYDHKELI